MSTADVPDPGVPPIADRFRLDGQVAIVTGGTRGIGEAIALAFGQQGARVVIASRKPEGVEAAIARLGDAGVEVEGVAAHTGKEADVEALVAGTVERHGRVDVLVNNAATNPHFGPMVEAEVAAFDKTVEVNLRGYWTCARAVARHLLHRGAPGAIVNVASMTALYGAPDQGIYAMTKAGVVSMTRTLAVELGAAGIRVNAIAPGFVETRLAKAFIEDESRFGPVRERAPLGRAARPDEIAGAAVYLASDAASFVTGHTLVVDGGLTIAGV